LFLNASSNIIAFGLISYNADKHGRDMLCQWKYVIEGCANGLMHKILCTEVKRNLPAEQRN